ncbi:MAG: FAD-dependent oxidoreductase [Bacillaceae bacterium]|nr:FAD-dependent oxidoreductase [Bacillaceae bacterium]
MGKKLIIIGAGIAGLTTGIALQRQGFDDVSIYERYPEAKSTGSGIILAPNALKAFAGLNLDPELIRAGR